MRERSIIFSAPMVGAILRDEKTVTRRVVTAKGPYLPCFATRSEEVGGGVWRLILPDDATVRSMDVRCPYGVPGDRLWVRESVWVSDCGKYFARDTHVPNDVMPDVVERATQTWWLARRYVPTGFDDTDRRYTHAEFPRMVTSWSNRGRTLRSGRDVRAFEVGCAELDQSIPIRTEDGGFNNVVRGRFSARFRKQIPAIYMPRWMSRIVLEVTTIGVERLHQITTEDVHREGLRGVPGDGNAGLNWKGPGYRDVKTGGYHVDLGDDPPVDRRRGRARRDICCCKVGQAAGMPAAVCAFAVAWDSINGARASWQSNPWVWRVEFRRVEVRDA